MPSNALSETDWPTGTAWFYCYPEVAIRVLSQMDDPTSRQLRRRGTLGRGITTRLANIIALATERDPDAPAERWDALQIPNGTYTIEGGNSGVNEYRIHTVTAGRLEGKRVVKFRHHTTGLFRGFAYITKSGGFRLWTRYERDREHEYVRFGKALVDSIARLNIDPQVTHDQPQHLSQYDDSDWWFLFPREDRPVVQGMVRFSSRCIICNGETEQDAHDDADDVRQRYYVTYCNDHLNEIERICGFRQGLDMPELLRRAAESSREVSEQISTFGRRISESSHEMHRLWRREYEQFPRAPEEAAELVTERLREILRGPAVQRFPVTDGGNVSIGARVSLDADGQHVNICREGDGVRLAVGRVISVETEFDPFGEQTRWAEVRVTVEERSDHRAITDHSLVSGPMQRFNPPAPREFPCRPHAVSAGELVALDPDGIYVVPARLAPGQAIGVVLEVIPRGPDSIDCVAVVQPELRITMTPNRGRQRATLANPSFDASSRTWTVADVEQTSVLYSDDDSDDIPASNPAPRPRRRRRGTVEPPLLSQLGDGEIL